jgi:hypothetical protein
MAAMPRWPLMFPVPLSRVTYQTPRRLFPYRYLCFLFSFYVSLSIRQILFYLSIMQTTNTSTTKI